MSCLLKKKITNRKLEKNSKMKENKVMPICWILILIILLINLSYTVYSFIDYNHRKISGNQRWEQVEERIKRIEGCCQWKK